MGKSILVCCILVIFYTSCKKSNPCGDCPQNISFKAVIIPIFAADCAITGCHNAITDTFHLNFDSAHAYVSSTEPGTGYVYAGNAAGSLLYTICESGGMPLNRPKLSDCEIQDIECWINQGALNN